MHSLFGFSQSVFPQFLKSYFYFKQQNQDTVTKNQFPQFKYLSFISYQI